MMKVALVVNQITEDIDSNLKSISKLIQQVDSCDLVLLPEAAITGLINNDTPKYDLLLGQPIPGQITDQLGLIASKNSINIVIGMLEREEKRLYDTAIFITSDGQISLKYRRITSGWYGKNVDSKIYRQGNEIPVLETKFGRFAIFICGDLFEEELIEKIKELEPDWLLFPFARSFDDHSWNQERWDKEEKHKYAKQVRKAGVTTFMVNYLGNEKMNDYSFGGAMVVSKDGNIISDFPLGKEGILFIEL